MTETNFTPARIARFFFWFSLALPFVCSFAAFVAWMYK
jgi:hypothetical protein